MVLQWYQDTGTTEVTAGKGHSEKGYNINLLSSVWDVAGRYGKWALRTENPRVGGSIPPLGTIFTIHFNMLCRHTKGGVAVFFMEQP